MVDFMPFILLSYYGIIVLLMDGLCPGVRNASGHNWAFRYFTVQGERS